MKHDLSNSPARWQEAFGPAPEAYRDDMRRTLAHITKEEPPVKRWTIRTVLLTALLVALLAGMALAAVYSTDLRSILGANNTLPEDFDAMVETAPRQSSSDMQGVTATVREAVSDGLHLYWVVAHKANDEGHAVLMGRDAERGDTGTHTVRTPNWSAIGEDQPRVVVGNIALCDIFGGIAAYEWLYEGTDTLVAHYSVPLDSLDQGAQARARIAFSPLVFTPAEDGTLVQLDQGSVEVTYNWPGGGAHGGIRRMVAETPLRLAGCEVMVAEMRATSLMTYLTLEYHINPETTGWDGAYLEACQADGTPFTLQRQDPDDWGAAWRRDIPPGPVVMDITARLPVMKTLPREIMIRARDTQTDEIIETVTVPLFSQAK